MPEGNEQGSEIDQNNPATDSTPDENNPNEDSHVDGTSALPEDIEFDENFDPRTLPEELQPAWKQMHGAFTRKMQSVSEQTKEAEVALSWINALNDEETRDDAIQQLAETLGYSVAEVEEALEDDDSNDEDDDFEFRDPRLDELLEERENEKLERIVTELEETINTEIEDLAKKAELKLTEDEIELIFDEVAKYGPDEDDKPQVERAFKRITGIRTRAVEEYRGTKKADAPAPPIKGGSSPTPPTHQPGDRKSRLARANNVVERSFASQ